MKRHSVPCGKKYKLEKQPQHQKITIDSHQHTTTIMSQIRKEVKILVKMKLYESEKIKVNLDENVIKYNESIYVLISLISSFRYMPVHHNIFYSHIKDKRKK